MHPNPSGNGSITISFESMQANLQEVCFNTFDQQVYPQVMRSSETVINVTGHAVFTSQGFIWIGSRRQVESCKKLILF